MDFDLNNGVLTIQLSGRVDTSNAEKTKAEILAIREANPSEGLIFDAENLEYISSAGLRVVLFFRKAEPSLKLINVSPEVYEVFDMTGFTEMLTIEKAYRRLSVEGCEVIGQGANGKVYRYDPETIVKVYFNPDALPDIHRERELARTAFVLGIPTAIPYDVVKVGEGYGSVFELLNAKSFAKLIQAEPEKLDYYVELYVDLLKKIHGTTVKAGSMPDMREVALNWAKFLEPYLPKADYDKLYSLVEAVPQSQQMLHGDYHIKNVMMQNDEVLLIDMDTLCMGNPVFELASVWLAYQGYGEVDHDVTLKFMGMPYELTAQIWDKTARMYFGTDDEKELKKLVDQAKIIGYTRNMRRTIRRNGLNTEDGRAVIENCKNRLHELLAEIDSIAY